MNFAKTFDHSAIERSLNSVDTDGASHHGYSFEAWVKLALGFTNEDGSPFVGKHRDTFDIPADVVARNPIIPNSLQGNWSIKSVKRGSSIGLGMASSQYSSWAKEGIVQCTAVYDYDIVWNKELCHFSITKIEPSERFWGNISEDTISKIDPMQNKHLDIYETKRMTKQVNRNRTGTIGLRNISRINDEGYESRNLQSYMNFNDYYKLVA
jgi:hypothetical protein|tara:strand:+ start:3532 stop:4161 length:630 start_codon:yes stop_codon:yes gene_type:complete